MSLIEILGQIDRMTQAELKTIENFILSKSVQSQLPITITKVKKTHHKQNAVKVPRVGAFNPDEVLDFAKEKGTVVVNDVVAKFSMSKPTAWLILTELTKQGKLIKDSTHNPMVYTYKQQYN